jgi:phage minor structural protein
LIYLTNGNMPLNAAYADEIVQIDSNTYQLTFRFPTSDSLWEKLKEETFLTADDLHGEQDFVIFEVEKKHGYIQVYANQVFTLLNNYVVNPISLDRQTGSTALSRFAGSINRDNPFSFFSDIEDRHTFNVGSKNAMEAFAKDKHSIIGQWGGDLVRHGYQVRLLKNGGSENESLFMYKKNLSSYQHKTSTKSLKTRITFITTVKGEGEKAPDRTFTVTIDSPLINKYSQIYEDVIEVNDQDVKDEASLRRYGEQYYRTSLCDMMEDSLELEVVGQSDVPVQMYDIVSLFHEVYNLDVRKKITKYTYSPMGKKLKTIGFGQFKSGLANAIGNAVSDAVKGEAQQLQSNFEQQLSRELKNADLTFDRQKEELINQFTDGLNATKARAEEVKRELSDTIDQRFRSFNNGPLQEAKRKAEEALQNSGASSLLAQEAKRIGLDSIARLEAFKTQATSAQTALSGDLDALKRTIANDIRPKQAQVEAEIAKQVEALIQAKNELAGVKSAQATYEETTTRRLAELTNLANGKASKSELTQTAEELASKIASVKVGSSRNYFRNSRSRTFTTGDQAVYDYRTFIVPDFWKNRDRLKRDYVRLSFDATFPVALARDTQANVHFSASPWYSYQLTFKGGTTERQHFEFTIDLSSSSETYQTNNVFIRFGTNYGFPAGLQVVIENAMLSVGNYFPAYQPAYEDQEDRVSVVESNFKQRADALDAGVNRLTEGLRTKADISALNVTAENIRQSVKSLETDTQNKLNQKLSLAEFEVRAGSIRQEILNATKDKADKTLVTAEAGKLREELASLSVGGRNLALGTSKEWSTPFTNFSGNPNTCPPLYKILTDGLQVGDTLRSKIILKYTDVRPAAGKTATIWLQGNGNVTGWTAGAYAGSPAKILNGSGEITFEHSFKITENHLKNIYWNWMFRTDFIASGSLQWKLAKVESGSVFTNWSPAPEDTEGIITEAKATFERTAQGLRTDLSAIQEYVNKDGQRQEALQRYTREESARQATAVRELVNRDFVGKSAYQEDVRGLERRFSEIATQTNNDIASKIAQYKQTVDGQFASILSQISGKANQTDFQRVRETSQLYERILGNTENGIADKVARMALTNQLFQVEVGKYGSDGINRALNTSKGWTSFITIASPAGINLNADLHKVVASGLVAGDKLHVCLEISIDDVQPITGKTATAVLQSWGDVKKWNSGNPFGYRLGNLIAGNNWRKIEYDVTLTEQMLGNNFWWLNVRVDGASRYKVHTKLLKIEKGSRATPWSPAPEDTDEAIRTVQSQLAGSWGVHNKNSVNEIIAGFNLAGKNAGIKAETIRLEGNTLVDKLTAIDGYFKHLFVGEGTFATLNTDVIRTNSITADKLVFNEALANRMVSNEIITSKLVASRAFVNALKAVTIDASQIVTGTLNGDRIYGGTIRGTEINGTTITGNSRITIGDNGFLRPTQEGGLQINVPETYSASKGIGVQLFGRNFGQIPKGMFIYNSPNWNGGNLIGESVADILLTVKGLTSLCNLYRGQPMSGLPINSNFRYGDPVGNLYRISFIAWDPRHGQMYVNDGTDTDGTWWFKPDASSSDKRLKTNIQDTNFEAIDFVKKLEFKQFDWKPDKFGYKKPYTNVGLIAQDVEKLDSSLVYLQGENLALDDFRLGNIALKAIQELSQRVETLERKLA